MRKVHIVLFILIILLNACLTKKTVKETSTTSIQQDLKEINVTPHKKISYRSTPTQEWQIRLTELDLQFNMNEHQMTGTATHYVNKLHNISDTLTLDAKAMTIKNVFSGLNLKPIPHFYDNKKLYIPLKINQEEKITIEFVAKPDEFSGKGSSAIRAAKGLYFINTSKTDSLKPTQVWTQGETEGNSVWFPTIDKPNHKMKFKIRATVPTEYDMLSNGILTDKKINGSQAIYTWEQNSPMSAYLVMMAIGKFHIHREKESSLPISYWVEPSYASSAAKIFDKTPQMIQYFENKLGTPFPWDKYDQVVVRDYVSGAMENTSASLFGEFVQKHESELIDNGNEGIVAHEMFHQWFGDLVTCESWSNLFLNEGFATFGELLWNETKSEQEAEMTAYSDLSRYLEYASNSADPIVNFYYADKEDMFNSLTYRKGSRVLNLLRSEIGEEAFFLGIKKYLATYQFNSAEVHDFRKIMEESSGRDLNQFFNQWLYQGGYPGLELNYSKNDKKLTIHYQQKNSDSNFIYQYPLVIKFIHPTLKSIHSEKIFIHKKQDSITLKTEFDVMPIIITDYHHNCLAKITEMKSDGEKLRSLENTNSYYEAARILDQTDSSTDKIIFDKMIIHLLQSDNTALIKLGLNNIPEKNTSFMSQLYLLVDHKNAQIRRRALQELSFNPQEKNIPIALQRLNDPSWQVQAAAIQCLSKSNYKDLDQIVKQNYTSASIDIVRTISNILIAKNNMADSNFYQYHITRSAGFNRSLLMNHYMKIAIASKDINQIKNTWKQISFYAMQMENISDRINATRVLAQSWNSIEDKKDLTSEFEALKSRILIAEKIDDVKKVWNTDKKL